MADDGFGAWAKRPPMGWNSWDCFATTVTEGQVKANARVMKEQLARYGWRYVVVDIQWYEPDAAGYAYRNEAQHTLDHWGRLLPAPNRFPSASGGAGFRPLADYVHSLGLEFGVHLMRGIPRLAVERNLPIKDTAFFARDIADTDSRCPWNPDMFGVDMSKPGAQAYYDSVFQLFAEWGVDYVKVDDMSRPYHEHETEIEAVRAAIDATGRPMVLSLSPGATALSAASHVARNANLWRISDDFWDNWYLVYEQFARLEAWNPHRSPGHWPDADMLPFGVLDMGKRSSRLTQDEQRLVMTLWSIARSPLMHGGDMTKMDDFTLSLLTNEEVLAVNQESERNRPLFDHDDLIAWTAEAGDGDLYLALFNARDRLSLEPGRAADWVAIDGESLPQAPARLEADLTDRERLVLVMDDGEGTSEGHPLGVWGDPVIELDRGEKLSLTELEWQRAVSRWNDIARDDFNGQPLRVGEQGFERALGVHAKSVIEYQLPAGARRFSVSVGIADSEEGSSAVAAARFMLFAVSPEDEDPRDAVEMRVALGPLGFRDTVRVRDLWAQQDLPMVEGELTAALPWHGAALFRLSLS
jgi:hypothetical protein